MPCWYGNGVDMRRLGPLELPSRRIVQEIIRAYEQARVHPGLYYGNMARNSQAVEVAMVHFNLAFHFMGIDTSPEVGILAARGWRKHNSFGVLGLMRQKGCSDEEMVAELIQIEIDSWTALLHRLGGPLPDDLPEGAPEPPPEPTEQMVRLLDRIRRAKAGGNCRRATLRALIAALRYVSRPRKGTVANLRALGCCAREAHDDCNVSCYRLELAPLLDLIAIGLYDAPPPSPRAAHAFGVRPWQLLDRACALQAELEAGEGKAP